MKVKPPFSGYFEGVPPISRPKRSFWGNLATRPNQDVRMTPCPRPPPRPQFPFRPTAAPTYHPRVTRPTPRLHCREIALYIQGGMKDFPWMTGNDSFKAQGHRFTAGRPQKTAASRFSGPSANIWQIFSLYFPTGDNSYHEQPLLECLPEGWNTGRNIMPKANSFGPVPHRMQ